jgi:hypothetical protein
MRRGLRKIAVIWGLFLVLLALPSRLGAHTNTDRDTVSLRFRLDNAELDLSYADNARNWQRFEQRFRAEYGNRNPICIQFDVYAGASPEGSRNRNLALGQARAEAIAAYLRERLGERAGTIELHNLGPRWDDLYDLVAASDEPWRDEVLQIIKARVKADPRWLDPREMRLRKLHDGLVWPELEEKYLAPLRSGISGAVVVSWHPERDTLVIRDTVVIEKREVIVHENYCRPETVAPAPRVREKADQTKAWAVKTNLLLLGVVAPNLEVELPLGEQNRWSVEFEAFAPWFIWNNNSQASQALNLGAEIRYWLGNREYHRWLDGWHIGLALAGGYYDWEWKKSDGYQGEYVNTYLNIGWQHRFGRKGNWAIDLGLGVGAMGTQYRHYYGSSVYPAGREEEGDQHLIWHDTGYFLWPGPCHANCSIVYLINYKEKNRRRK